MKGRHYLLLALAAVLNACSHTPVTPTSVTRAQIVDAVAPQLTIRIDSLGSAVAIAGVSEVTFDAGTSGKFRYDLQFGDGQSATKPVVSHVYTTPGTYTVTLTITDFADRQTSTSATVSVKAVQGTWLYAGFNKQIHRVEVRRFIITSQQGPDVHGRALQWGLPDGTFTGRLSPDRTLRIALDDGSATFEGSVPGTVYEEGAVFSLTAHGGSSDGQTLPFTAVIGEPVGAPPEAVFTMRFFSFGAPFAVQGFSPILFEGSGSRGEGLRYFIEFGDGEFGVDSTAVHPIATAGTYTTRLIVVDRFGRVDFRERSFEVVSLVANGYYFFWQGGDGILTIDSQNGPDVTGNFRRGNSSPGVVGGDRRFTGTLSGERDIRLVLTGSNVVLSGTLDLHGQKWPDWRLVLTQRGGAEDGKRFEFYFRDGY